MVMSLKCFDPEALNILFFIHGRFTSSEGIYVRKNRLFVFVFILETELYTAFRNCSIIDNDLFISGYEILRRDRTRCAADGNPYGGVCF